MEGVEVEKGQKRGRRIGEGGGEEAPTEMDVEVEVEVVVEGGLKMQKEALEVKEATGILNSLLFPSPLHPRHTLHCNHKTNKRMVKQNIKGMVPSFSQSHSCVTKNTFCQSKKGTEKKKRMPPL